MASAVRVLYPALAEGWQMSNSASIGLLYAAIPLGAALGALTSGQLAHTANARAGADADNDGRRRLWRLRCSAVMPFWALGDALSGAVWLAERDKLAATVHVDPNANAGKYAGAH